MNFDILFLNETPEFKKQVKMRRERLKEQIMSEVNYGIEDFMAEEERYEAQDWGDEDDEDVVTAEESHLNSWGYLTFQYIKENDFFASILNDTSERFKLVNSFDEEDHWGDLYTYHTVLDKENDRFVSFFNQGDDSDYGLDGEVFPVRKIEFVLHNDNSRELTINEKSNFIRDIKEGRYQWKSLL